MIIPPFRRSAIEATISGIFQVVVSPLAGLQRCTVYEGTSVQYRHRSSGDHSGPSPSHALQSTTHSAALMIPSYPPLALPWRDHRRRRQKATSAPFRRRAALPPFGALGTIPPVMEARSSHRAESDKRDRISDRDRESYAENGFLVVENVVSNAEIEEYRDVVDQLVEGRIDCSDLRGDLGRSSRAGKAGDRKHHPHHVAVRGRARTWRRARSSSARVGIARTLLGRRPRARYGHVDRQGAAHRDTDAMASGSGVLDARHAGPALGHLLARARSNHARKRLSVVRAGLPSPAGAQASLLRRNQPRAGDRRLGDGGRGLSAGARLGDVSRRRHPSLQPRKLDQRAPTSVDHKLPPGGDDRVGTRARVRPPPRTR